MNEYKKKLHDYLLSEGKGVITRYDLLSGILSFSHKVDDPEALAGRLIKENMSVENALKHAASGAILQEGVDRNTAFLLRLVYEASVRQMVQAGIGSYIRSPLEACRFFEEAYKGVVTEELRLVCLDRKLRILDYAIIARGDHYAVTFDKDELLRKVVNSGCKLCILAHNHPGAPSTPSDADYVVTRKLIRYLRELGITLIEHVIIGENGAKCMLVENTLHRLFR